jgi:hypothetical protein
MLTVGEFCVIPCSENATPHMATDRFGKSNRTVATGERQFIGSIGAGSDAI